MIEQIAQGKSFSKNAEDARSNADGVCRILALDGGGAKGFYTLGVLKHIELMTKKPLWQCFDYIYGTSTGAIIASLLALGYSVDDIHDLYAAHVPTIMTKWLRSQKSLALEMLAEKVFGGHTPGDFKTGIGIVATRWKQERPMIFKNSLAQLHGRKESFEPFHGVSISDAVQASCSAYPFFNKMTVKTSLGDEVELIDGGYCANNPALYALADAVAAIRIERKNVRLISVGVGLYPETKRWSAKFVRLLPGARLAQKILEINTQSMDQLRSILFSDIPTIRISDASTSPELATDLTEHNMKKLNLLRQHGFDSFAKQEEKLREFLVRGQG